MEVNIIRSFWNFFFPRRFTARVKIKKQHDLAGNYTSLTWHTMVPSRASINQRFFRTHTPAFSCLKHLQSSWVTNCVNEMFCAEDNQQMRGKSCSQQELPRSYSGWTTNNPRRLFQVFLRTSRKTYDSTMNIITILNLYKDITYTRSSVLDLKWN
jgi:hypothetical protein